MNGVLIRWLVLTISIILTSYLVDGIYVESFFSALFAALVLGILNALFRPVLLVITRLPDIKAAIRNTFSTGLSTPLVASVRNPSKYSLPSNSNDQDNIASRFTFERSSKSKSALIAAAV